MATEISVESQKYSIEMPVNGILALFVLFLFKSSDPLGLMAMICENIAVRKLSKLILLKQWTVVTACDFLSRHNYMALVSKQFFGKVLG